MKSEMIPPELKDCLSPELFLIASESAIPPAPLLVAAAASLFHNAFLTLNTFSFSSKFLASSVDAMLTPPSFSCNDRSTSIYQVIIVYGRYVTSISTVLLLPYLQNIRCWKRLL